MRLTCYSSGAWPCGIANYHRHLAAELALHMECETAFLPSVAVRRSDIPGLLRRRHEYAALAARADGSDAALVEFITFWNGTRAGEDMLPVFLKRLRAPLYLILHEWPEIPLTEAHSGRLITRTLKKFGVKAYRKFAFNGSPYECWLADALFGRARRIWVHSEELQSRLIASGVSPERVTLSIHPTFPAPEPTWSNDEVDERFKTAGRRVLLLFGFPHPRKNYELALEALAQLPSDVIAVLAGSTSGEFRQRQAEQLHLKAHQLGVGDRFILTGELGEGEIASLFHRSILGIAPFRYATGSGSISYFAAAGLPVVASDLPSLRMLVDDGAGILLFPEGDATALASVVSSLLDDPAARGNLRTKNLQFAARHSFEHLALDFAHHLQRTASLSRETLDQCG
jgi:glycosyltransferase involved in cell wall biosynthesis